MTAYVTGPEYKNGPNRAQNMSSDALLSFLRNYVTESGEKRDLGPYKESIQEALRIAVEVDDLGYGGEHSDIEELVRVRTNSYARQTLQDRLNKLASEEEKRDDVYGPQGEVLPYARPRQRKLETLFGEVVVSRLGYHGRDTGSVFPLDALLNLPTTRYSHCLQMTAAHEVALRSYDQTGEQISERTEARYPKRQIEEMVRQYVRYVDDYYALPLLQGCQASQENLMILTLDGKGVVMLPEDLREETRRRAEETSNKQSRRLSQGEKKNHKRMATVIAVYEVERYYRRADEIFSSEHRPKDAPKPINKRVWASLKKEPAEVLDDAMKEVKRRDPQGTLTLVILVDGQEEQLRQVYAALTRHGLNAFVLQDIYHVSEYIWNAAPAFHKEAGRTRERWVEDRLEEVLKGNAFDVGTQLRRSATRLGLSQSERAPVDRCANYLQKNSERLNYAKALRIGSPIATGIIEGACRHLVKVRMELSGARWSLEGAEAVLQLRALVMSGDWKEYYAFHKQGERLRNYPQYGTEQCTEQAQAA
jgi:hypothetical protein